MSFGNALAKLRRSRGWSQEELANRAGISQRHVSFLETGRSQPGQAALAKLARAMALKGWEQRALFRPLTGREESPPRAKLDAALPKGFLERLSIWPACTFKPDGTLVQSNAALDDLLDFVAGGEDLWDKTAGPDGPNMYDLVFHPEGLIRWMDNPEQVIPETLRRLRIEASLNAALARAVTRFEAYPSVRRWDAGLGDPPSVLQETYRFNGQSLSVISVLSSIASPGEYDIASLRIETFVPADEASVRFLSSRVPQATAPAT